MDQNQFHQTSNKSSINFTIQPKTELLLIFLLAIYVFFIYSNTIKAPFIFDDSQNIQDNDQIRLTRLTLDGIISAGFKSPIPNRPVANISFALNYYFNRYDIRYYHLTNILIHITTGIILYFFLKITLGLSYSLDLLFKDDKNNLFDPPVYSSHSLINHYNRVFPEVILISFFTTCIWLVHPVQTQSVSYIVQRMNSMAAMFYILSFFLYVKARVDNTGRKKYLLYSGCILSALLSFGSKEISATLPFFIFLYEWYFFQNLSLKWLKRNLFYFSAVLAIIIFVAFCYMGIHPIKSILSGYDVRNFTLWERILTEFRVVIYYISLLIFPHPMRLNLLHDFPVSHSFTDPITTIFSILVISALIVTAIWMAKKERLLSFCILWFLGNLIIESSVIGLEIIYEHRVYLPSMFFILILVILVYRFIKNKRLATMVLCVVALIFSGWTYQRNMVWADDVTFWKDCVTKSPRILRSHNNLGIALARSGRIDDGIKQYYLALKINPAKAEAYYNLGNAYMQKGDFVKAIENYRQALRLNPHSSEANYNMGIALARSEKIDDAMKQYSLALKINPAKAEAYYNLGNAYMQKGDFVKAINNYRQALRINPDFFEAYYNIGRILSNEGKIGRAIRNYQKVLIINSEMTPALYNLAWIYATSKNKKYRNGPKAVELAEKLCKLTGYRQSLAMDVLAAAFAEAGKFDKAAVTGQKALSLAMKEGHEKLVESIKKRLKQYKAKCPYRQAG